jgi:hypothetical protein
MTETISIIFIDMINYAILGLNMESNLFHAPQDLNLRLNYKFIIAHS